MQPLRSGAASTRSHVNVKFPILHPSEMETGVCKRDGCCRLRVSQVLKENDVQRLLSMIGDHEAGNLEG